MFMYCVSLNSDSSRYRSTSPTKLFFFIQAVLSLTGVSTLRRVVSGEKQNLSGNLKICRESGDLENFTGNMK